MKKSTIFMAVTTAAILTSTSSFADEVDIEMEKCIATVNGKSLIKEHKSDCNTTEYSCAGQNTAKDLDAWILVPKGECAKIKEGNFSGLSDDIKEKLIGSK